MEVLYFKVCSGVWKQLHSLLLCFFFFSFLNLGGLDFGYVTTLIFFLSGFLVFLWEKFLIPLSAVLSKYYKS